MRVTLRGSTRRWRAAASGRFALTGGSRLPRGAWALKEIQQTLNKHQPQTLGQAARLSGVTPAAVALLLVHLKRGFSSLNQRSA